MKIICYAVELLDFTGDVDERVGGFGSAASAISWAVDEQGYEYSEFNIVRYEVEV